MSPARGVTIASDLAFPIDVATQTTLIVGKRGSGKTNTAGRLVEQLIRCGVPCAILDPADVWWGLKAPGSRPGLEVYVFGGRHADLPLEPGGGALLADVVIDNAVSVVLSVRHLSGAERGRFVTEFAQRLLQRNQDPLHVVLEEAHEVAPQSAMPGEQVMLGAIKRLWKLGRSSGIGGTAITQRPAALHKDVTTQAEILAVHRLIGPQDVAAVREWIKYHGQAESILPELATLRDGEAFVWGPEFPKGDPIGLRRVQVLMRETYDAAATPKAGERRAEPRELKAVDMEKLRASMAATIERQKADDPRELRKRIKALERELEDLKQPPSAQDCSGLRVDAQAYSEAVGAAQRLAASLASLASGELHVRFESSELAFRYPPPEARPMGRAGILSTARARVGQTSRRGARGPEQRVLDALAELEALGVPEPERVQVAFLAGYSNLNSKGFANAIGRLRTSGRIAYPGPSRLALTASGREVADSAGAPRSAEELHERLLKLLGGAHGRVLRPLLRAYPQPVERPKLAAAAGYGNLNSKGFANALGRLRSLALIAYPSSGMVVAQPVLFLDERRS